MKLSKFLMGIAVVVLFGAVSTPLKADTLNALDSGWYSSVGLHTAGNTNYLTGSCAGCVPAGPERRSFFVFDLTGVTQQIASGTLRLFNPLFGFASPDATETYSLFDVSTAIADLSASWTTATGIWGDLGSGTSYGSQVVSSADNNSIVEIALNSAAIADLNAGLGGFFAFGGAITTLSGSPVNEYIFNSTITGSLTELAYTTVPEPSTLLLLGLGLAGLVGVRRKRKRA